MSLCASKAVSLFNLGVTPGPCKPPAAENLRMTTFLPACPPSQQEVFAYLLTHGAQAIKEYKRICNNSLRNNHLPMSVALAKLPLQWFY